MSVALSQRHNGILLLENAYQAGQRLVADQILHGAEHDELLFGARDRHRQSPLVIQYLKLLERQNRKILY